MGILGLAGDSVMGILGLELMVFGGLCYEYSRASGFLELVLWVF